MSPFAFRALSLISSVGLSGLALAGCSAAVGDLGGFTENPAACRMDGDRNTVRDFNIQLVALSPHTTHYFHADVVDRAEGRLQSRIIIDPLEFGTQVITVENAVPPGDYFVDFYGDVMPNRMPDPPPTDHTWRRPLCSDGTLYFEHVFDFEELDNAIGIGNDFSLQLNNVPPSLADVRTEARLVFTSATSDEGRTVAMYRHASLGTAATFDVPEVVDVGSDYAVLWFHDMNDDTFPNEGDIFCGERQAAPSMNGVPLVVTVDLTAALDDGRCDLLSLDHTALP